MNASFLLLARLSCFAVLVLFSSSCGTFKPVKDNASRHLLDPAIEYRPGTRSSPAVAVARPFLPVYLDRQQLVSRDAAGSVQIEDNRLWSEPLSHGVSRAVAANLARLTGSTAVMPVDDFLALEYAHLVEMRISQFEPDLQGNLVLECVWKLQPVRGGDTDFRSFRTEVPISLTVPLVNGRVTAMNEALARLSREIARRL